MKPAEAIGMLNARRAHSRQRNCRISAISKRTDARAKKSGDKPPCRTRISDNPATNLQDQANAASRPSGIL
jgi:hypothetical protein